MDKVIAVVLSASVILLMAVFASSLLNNSIDWFVGSTEDPESSGCDYQKDKVTDEDNNIDRDDFSAGCKNSEEAGEAAVEEAVGSPLL